MKNKTVACIFNEINNAKKILIVSHVNPDGDTLGAMCALKLFIGKKADTLIQNLTGAPETYNFLPEINLSKNLNNVDDIYDLVICVDIAAIDRVVQKARWIFDNAKMTINIDHHKTNNGYAKINWIIPDASSAGEVLFNMLREQDVKITKEIAECLYVSILTDTGGFRYENTKPETLEAAAQLIKLGVDNADLAKKCYNTKPKNMIMFQAAIISKTQFMFNNRVALAAIAQEDLERFNANNEFTEGIAETLRTIKTVEVSAVLKESESQTTKVSLRSDRVDVCQIVKKFNGGGHIHAAGCTIKKPLRIAQEMLICEIEKCLGL